MPLDLSALPAAPETRPTLAEAIAAALAEAITRGEMPPGTTLEEERLALAHGASRTPVREALQQLAARDLVRIAPRQGVTVARLSISQVRAIMETIGELEGVCARLAARRVDDALRTQLDAALQQCQDAAIQGGTEEYALANTAFHEVIYVGSRNPYLADLIRTARRQIYRYSLRNFVTKAQINKSMQDHLKVARAIQDGDELAATQQMMLHVPSGSTGFSEFLARMPMSLFETEAGES